MAIKEKKIIEYSWGAKDSSGKKVTGDLKSEDLGKAKQILRGQGLTSIKIKKKSGSLFEKKQKVEVKDIANFTRQLSTMLNSGVPLIQSFDIVAEGTDNMTLKKVVLKLSKDVSEGDPLAEALKKHPKYFNDLFCNLVGAGEKSGSLEGMLSKVADYMEKSEALKKKIKKALAYPITVMIVAGIVTVLLLVKVVPQFSEMFESFGGGLPTFTQYVLNASIFMQEWYIVIIAFFLGLKYGIRHALTKRKYQYMRDKKLLSLPIFGPIVQKSAVSGFARTLSTTFAAGVPMLEGLDAAAGATGNLYYMEKVFEVRDEVELGQQLNFALKNSKVFPSMVVQMVAIGEESGKIDYMLQKSADNLDEDVDTLVDSMTAMIEPMVMAVLGVLVGGLLIAMYLPIFEMGGAM
jgi:type IV pilus assembly protein PilC